MTARQQQRRTILVVGGTGTVGSAVLHELLTDPLTDTVAVRAIVRRHPPSDAFPASVAVVHADLAEPVAIRRALAGVEAAFYASPHEHDEVDLARTFVAACARTDVRLVFAGVHQSGRTLRGRLMVRLLITVGPASPRQVRHRAAHRGQQHRASAARSSCGEKGLCWEAVPARAGSARNLSSGAVPMLHRQLLADLRGEWSPRLRALLPPSGSDRSCRSPDIRVCVVSASRSGSRYRSVTRGESKPPKQCVSICPWLSQS